MSAFNVIRGFARCPRCDQSAEFEVQFKYGDTWQHTYRVGDRLKWGGNDIGRPGRRRVLVEGIGGPCPHCAADDLAFDLMFKDDVLTAIEPAREPHAARGSEGFVVIEA